jgi:hypothetical protein
MVLSNKISKNRFHQIRTLQSSIDKASKLKFWIYFCIYMNTRANIHVRYSVLLVILVICIHVNLPHISIHAFMCVNQPTMHKLSSFLHIDRSDIDSRLPQEHNTTPIIASYYHAHLKIPYIKNSLGELTMNTHLA